MGLEALPRAGGDTPVALKRGGWRSHGGGGHIPERAVRRWELIWLGEGESCTCWGWGGIWHRWWIWWGGSGLLPGPHLL